VTGWSECRIKQEADAFVEKHVALLPEVSTSFVAAHHVSADTPLRLESSEWRLSVLVEALREVGRSSGYIVRIELRPAIDGPFDHLVNQAYAERRDLRL